MFTKLTDGAVKALLGAIKVVLLVVVLIALVAWAKANPDAAQAVLNKVADAAAAIISWVADWITRELS
jgi:ABC-type nitrate/sulfonate/bicarbonate transport system substrate-binding protein